MKNKIFHSIYTKFLVTFLGVLFFSAILTFGVIYWSQVGNVMEQIRVGLVNQVHVVQTLNQEKLSDEAITDLYTQGIVVSQIYASLDEVAVNLSEDESAKLENGEIVYRDSHQGQNLPMAMGKLTDGYVVSTPNLERNQIAGFVNIQRTSMLVTLLIGSVLIVIAVAMIAKPIKAVSEATKKVADGDFDLRLKVKGKDELAVLAQNFNIMTEALSRNDYIHRDFVSNVSHEFKTPIASIKGFGKLLKDPELSEIQRQEYIDIIVDESDRLWKLSANVLKLSELENGVLGLKKEAFSLDESIRRVVLLLQEKWEAKNIDLDIQLDEMIYKGDQELMAQVIINLLTNAIHHTPENGEIRIDLKATAKEVIVKIVDTGKGITTEDQEKIFDRFYKADQSRSTPGTGLGLTISQRIVSLHGGTIAVESTLGAGSTFCVRLPK
ncbi:HAMP domain-containing sensor histidine kinase [Acetobacterium sp. K1/6]|jgi:signal transduction histidine kinase|uniref:HAMP domain-containing sensor histidine kinase n=1 Tax=Acetobacterium sp. K1/6 TaxID=3055467 RepID=UPI002ACA2900|nr:HAMP domain-containing sensor histidine kinase [Acetobacterium sp. K1/6]MDZ5724291.1 HAMP domain-containing sensor histidine kinase [Acetobacterium sp. K1/6]